MPRKSGVGHGVQDPGPRRGQAAQKCDTTWKQRDPDFAGKMAEVLCVYRQVKILKQAAAVSKRKKKPSDAVAIISYDERMPLRNADRAPPSRRPSRAMPGRARRAGAFFIAPSLNITDV
jgi:hypothetical protein